MAISYDIDPPITESRPTENDAQFSDVNEVVEEYEVFDHAFMEKGKALKIMSLRMMMLVAMRV